MNQSRCTLRNLELEQIKPEIAADFGKLVMNRNILFVPIRILSILLLFYMPICSAEFNWKPDYISIGLGELNSAPPWGAGASWNTPLLAWTIPEPKHKSADDSSFTLGLGFNINENFSLEIAYSDLGNSEEWHASKSCYGVGQCSAIPNYSHYYNHSSFQINSLTKTQLNNNIDLYLKLGIGRTNISKKASNTLSLISSDPQENIELIYGVGLSYDLINKLKLFVEFIDNGHDSIKSGYSAGIKYSF